MQLHDVINESFRHYKVKHKRTGKEYKVTALSKNSALDKARAQHGGTASRFSGTSTSDFEIVEGIVKENMIGKPDAYYDADERKQAYDELQDALDGMPSWAHDYIKDGVCPECAGSGYMDGEETFINDDGEEEESSECYGMGNYGCDQGEMEFRNDTVSWKEIMDHDERQKEREELANKPQPKDEELKRAIEQLHKEYVKTGRMNAFELPSLLRQMFPEISKGKAREIGSEFFKRFQTEEKDQGSSEGEMMTAKMLAKALGDENRWAEMSASELYSELESESPKKADMIALVAKMLYDVKLTESNFEPVPELEEVIETENEMPSLAQDKKKVEIVANEETYDCDDAFFEDYGYLGYSIDENDMFEAEYRGRKVKLNKPMQGDVKKFKVYVKDPKTGNVKKVNFGHGGSSVKGKAMKIRKNNPKARKSFRARHNCDNPGPKTKARYWSCRKW